MMSEYDSSPDADNEKTPAKPVTFDFDAYPPDTLFHERRGTAASSGATNVRRAPRRERRRRVDPTTFEKQYTTDELEFMNAMQCFKVQSGKTFPSHGEVLRVARRLGYLKMDRTESETD